MGFIAKRKHNFKLLEDGWISVNENPPKDNENVYLHCKYMMDDFVVIGKIAGNQRVESDGDPDVFFRSAVLFWKPLSSN